MKQRISPITLLLTICLALIYCTGCTTTTSENGVTIENSDSYNPLNYIPWF